MVPSHRAVSRFLSLRCITTAGSPHFHRPSRRPPPHAPICVGRTSVARCLLAVKHGRVRSPILAGTQVRSEDSSTASRSRRPSPLSNQASTPPERDGGSSAAGDGEVGAKSRRCGPCLTSLELYFRPPMEEGERPGRSAVADPSSTLLTPPWPPPLPCPAAVGSSTTCFSSIAPPHNFRKAVASYCLSIFS
jgi:hypothetical protein